MELIAKIFNGLLLLTIFAKSVILTVWLSSEHASALRISNYLWINKIIHFKDLLNLYVEKINSVMNGIALLWDISK